MNYRPAPQRTETNADAKRAERETRRKLTARKRDEFRPMTKAQLQRYLQENAR